jgi:hypothetical protein
MNGTTAMVPYETREEPIEGEWMTAEEAEAERERRRREREREGETIYDRGRVYGSREEAERGTPREARTEARRERRETEKEARWEAREDVWEDLRRQAAEDAYREQVREELRREGYGQEETTREEIDRLMREEEERMKAERMRKREEEAEREKMKFERERLGALKQAQKLERQKMGFESREMRRREGGKIIEGLRKAATLGGPIRMHERTAYLYGASGMRHLVAPAPRPKPTLDRLREATYPSGGMRELTGTGGMRRTTQPVESMRELTMPSRGRMAYGGTRGFADLLVPRTQKLQRLTMMTGMGQTPIARASTLGGITHLAKPMGYKARVQQTNDTVYRRMRALTIPNTGMNQTEQMAYAEIRANHDKDTREHVIGELAKLGLTRQEASQAIDSLMRQGLIKRGGSFRGEPVLEVAG